MSDQWAPAPPRKGPRRWPRRLGWIAVSLFILTIILYFVVTSHTFLDSVVVPKVNSALGIPVVIGDSSISAFRKVSLRDVKVGGSTFEEPIVTVREVRVRYSLFDILGGNINVHEVTLVSPVVHILQHEDGSTNLDPLLKPRTAEDTPPTEASKPPQFRLGRFLLTNAVVRHTKLLPGGGRQVAELSNVNIAASNLGNAKAGALTLGLALRLEKPQSGTNAAELIEAKLAGGFELALTGDLQPESIRGNLTFDVLTPPSAAKDIKGTSALLECDITPTEVRQLALRFKQGERTLGQITAAGPLDLARKEGQINLQVTSIDRHALNVVGAAAGLDFGSTTINANQQITIANAGQLITAAGRLSANKLSIVQKGAATRPLDLNVDYDVRLDQEHQSALIQRFTISGEQDAVRIIRGGLSAPMRLAFGNATNVLEQSAFDLQVTNFNLADWRAFVGEISGSANLNLHVNAADAGKKIEARLDSRIVELTAVFGSNKVDRANVDLSLRAGLDDMKAFRVDDLVLRIGRGIQTAATVVLSAKGNTAGEADASATLDADFARITNIVALSGIPNATLKLSTQLSRRGEKLETTNFIAELQQAGRIAGKLHLAAKYDGAATNGLAVLSMQVPSLFALSPTNPAPAKPLSLDLNVEASLANKVAGIRNLAGKLTQSGKSAGSFAAKGEFHTELKTGSIEFGVTDLNEGALGPFVDSALGSGRTLKGCSITLKSDAQYNPRGATSMKSELQVARLLIDDPARQLPSVPLGAAIKLSASMQSEQASLDAFSADLAMAEAPGAQIRATGKYHLKTKAAEGTLKVANLNEKFLAPFAAAALSNKQLASVSINVDLAGRYEPARDASVRGDVNVSDLLIVDPEGKLPKTPLSVGLELNTALATNQIVSLERMRLKLTPTARAKNELNLGGKLDLSRSNKFGGDLQLVAESLDLTPYYDMLTSPAATNVTAPAPSPTVSTTPPSRTATPNATPRESDPIRLPFERFNFGINIGQLYLRDVAIHNWQTGIKLNDAEVQVAPLQLLVNGAPVKGAVALNLGVPGYRYDLSLTADKIPAAPIVDTFSPQQKGKIKGDLLLACQIKGAGTTGRSLQKNLGGTASFSFTNANFQLTAPWIKTLFYPIGLAVGAPELVNAPVSWVGGTASVGDGKINLTQFNLVSDTFTADTKGESKIADVLMDSPLEKWPMHIALRRSLAQRVGRIPRNTPPDAAYVKMPDFVHVAGTLGSPKPEINKLALAGTISRQILDKVVQEKTGGVNPLNPLAK